MAKHGSGSRFRAVLAVFLGMLTAGLIHLAVMPSALDTLVRVVLLVLAGACVAVMFAMYLYGLESGPSITAEVSGVPPKGRLSVVPKELAPPKREIMSVAPTIREKPDSALEDPSAKAVLDDFYAILEKPDPARYQRGAEHFVAHVAVLAKSWKALANYARCLAMLGDFDSAREHAETLLHLHGATPEAVASYHDLMILCVASRTPETAGGLRDALLKERLHHVEEGLRALPNHMSLLLNGFETSVALSDYDGALQFLRRAVNVDRTSAAIRIQRAIDADPPLFSGLQHDEAIQAMLRELGVRTVPITDQGRS
ncbi:MAG: hypothetical protein NTX17_00170 [Candidatus Eisenbacteria bacterium]|nr:hypothetical protein [Candidatus Eisenbacteria bacterium]